MAGGKISGYVSQWKKNFNHTCGDVNNDGTVSIADVFYLKDYYFNEGALPVYWGSGDMNCDRLCNIVDIAYLIDYLFYEGTRDCCE